MADLNDWDDPGHETDAAGANDSLDQTHEHDQQRKRSGRPQNAVWQHFNKAPATKDNPHSGAKCLLCPWKRPHVRVAQAIRHLLQECPGATPERRIWFGPSVQRPGAAAPRRGAVAAGHWGPGAAAHRRCHGPGQQ